MVKLFFLGVYYKMPTKAVHLKSCSDVSTFSFFQRSSVQEFMKFTSQVVVERTVSGTRSSVQEKEYTCHCYVRGDNLAGIVISDQEYPNRVAHTLLMKVLDDFASKVPEHVWPEGEQSATPFIGLDKYLATYQNPKQADAMTKIQEDLDETKIIMHNTIEAVLQRGEKLDDLVKKSDDLSEHSKAFYKTAKKTNQCSCVIL